MAELRKQALLASGVQIEGLQQQGQASKRPVYDNRKKKKGPASQQTGSGPSTREPSPVREEKPATPEPISVPGPEKQKQEQEEKTEDVKSDWDASSGEEEKPAADSVKDSWDADSDEEDAKPSAPAKAAPACEPSERYKRMGLLKVDYSEWRGQGRTRQTCCKDCCSSKGCTHQSCSCKSCARTCSLETKRQAERCASSGRSRVIFGRGVFLRGRFVRRGVRL